MAVSVINGRVYKYGVIRAKRRAINNLYVPV